MLWAPGAEPQLVPNGTISPGAFDAPWVNALQRRRARRSKSSCAATRPTGSPAGRATPSVACSTRTRGPENSFWGDADQRHTLSLYGNYRLSSRPSVSATVQIRFELPDGRIHRGAVGGSLGQTPVVDGRPLFYGLSTERNTLRLPAYSRLDVRADRAFNWSGRRLVVFVDVANVLNRTNLRNASYFVDRAGRVFETTESLMPIVPSGGLVIEF